MKTFDIASKVRENIRMLKPYSSARDDFQGVASIYLDANENPNDTGLNRYPDPHQIELKKKIAGLKHVNTDQIFLGNGSDEAIDLLIRAFCKPGIDNILIPAPTYGMYSISAAINDIAIKQPLLTPDFDLDEGLIIKTWDDKTRMMFLCSPNNPSANLFSLEKIERLLIAFDGLVVVDEAYIDFTDQKGFLPMLGNFPNLVVLQTLSKAWGLAGIRLGMCFARPDVISVLNKIKPPYNISILTQQVALEKLNEVGRKNDWVLAIKIQREVLKSELGKLNGVIKIFPSDANFLLVRMKDSRKVYEKMVSRGIILRDRSSVALCNDCLRITVGTSEENRTLIDAFKQL